MICGADKIFIIFKILLLQGRLTCLKNVIGFCPMAWASPILALMTSLKGFLAPWKRWIQNSEMLCGSYQMMTVKKKKTQNENFHSCTDRSTNRNVSGHETGREQSTRDFSLHFKYMPIFPIPFHVCLLCSKWKTAFITFWRIFGAHIYYWLWVINWLLISFATCVSNLKPKFHFAWMKCPYSSRNRWLATASQTALIPHLISNQAELWLREQEGLD